MISIGSLCWSFLFVSVNAFATYLSTPELEWVSNGGHEMGRGNGMVVTPDNELVIYTSSKGVLRSLETKDGKLGTRGYEVIPAVKGVGWTLECTSSVTYHEDSSGQAFVVYAYVNIPPVSSTSEATRFVSKYLNSHTMIAWYYFRVYRYCNVLYNRSGSFLIHFRNFLFPISKKVLWWW